MAGRGLAIVELVKEIMHMVKRMTRRQFEAVGITGPQGMLLGHLVRHGAMKVTELSARMGLSASTVSGILDRLERQGMVRRERSGDDRRVVIVDVTPQFKADYEKRFEEMEKKVEQILSAADEEEIETIVSGLEALKRVLERSQLSGRPEIQDCDADIRRKGPGR